MASSEPAPAPPAAPLTSWLIVRAGLGADRVFDPGSYAASDSLWAGRLDVSAAWSPGWADGRLGLDVRWLSGGSTASLQQRWTATTTTQSAHVGLVYRPFSLGDLGFYGRAALTAGRTTFTLNQGSGDALESAAWRPGLAGTLGAELIGHGAEAAIARSVNVGVFVEVGGELQLASVQEALAPHVSGDPKPVPVAFAVANAGALNLSGFTGRCGLLLRY
jgi:hypothetical protein